MFDNTAALLGTSVQKFGRTTKLTKGPGHRHQRDLHDLLRGALHLLRQVGDVVDQLVIEPAGFSDGGDSGSLIVTDNGDRRPVALLFAGSETQTIASRIDLVLNYFGVTIDDGGAAPPPPVMDAAVSSLGAPASVTSGNTVNVTVSVQNVGTQAISAPFGVSLQDATDQVAISTQSIGSLAAGASTTLTFIWNTTGASLGDHTLTAQSRSQRREPREQPALRRQRCERDGRRGDLDPHWRPGRHSFQRWLDLVGCGRSRGARWESCSDQRATVVGQWSRNGFNSNTCTTGDLGGNGTCIMLFPSLRVKSVTFTVNSATMAGKTYAATGNHDSDGDSNGTTIKVNKP